VNKSYGNGILVVLGETAMRQTLKEAQAALATALRDLEATRMTRHDDAALSGLKADIRRTLEKADLGEELPEAA
jgi:hypothetical protein